MAANETDPLATRLSGTDPQSLLEYITRQRIYDSRYWKEECFGLTTAHVLEKAASLQSMGVSSHCHFMCLLLKLLQLFPEHELIVSAFIHQDDFKYVRALGALYIRMTSRPVDVYTSLEPLLQDDRTLRVYVAPKWTTLHMDEYIDMLLVSQKSSCCWTMALPRLPARKFLEQAGYLDEQRPTALQADIDGHGGLLEYLRHLALVERYPSAIAALAKRSGELLPTTRQQHQFEEEKAADLVPTNEDDDNDNVADDSFQAQDKAPPKPKQKKAKTGERNYNNIFKKTKTKKALKQQGDDNDDPKVASTVPTSTIEGSDEYWNEQRAKLGLGKLK